MRTWRARLLALPLLGFTHSALAQSTAQPIDMNEAATATPLTRMDKEVIAVMSMWPGDYDNREQVQIDTDMGRTKAEHLRMHAAVRQVDLPAIGPHLLYIEDYNNNDTTQSVRHGIYEVMADNDGKSVRVKTYQFKDPTKWRGAGNDLGKLKTMSRADLAEVVGCDITLKRDGDAFGGGTTAKTCMIGKATARDFQARLMNDQVWLRERTINPKTAAVIDQTANFAWHQMERARFFSCMIDPPRSMQKPGQNGHVVRIHDQGGTYTFPYADGRTLFMSLRNTWSYNMNRKTLVVTLQENDENGKGLGYAWSEPGADRLGMNPLWIHVQCDLATPENLEMQRRMRSVL